MIKNQLLKLFTPLYFLPAQTDNGLLFFRTNVLFYELKNEKEISNKLGQDSQYLSRLYFRRMIKAII
jgi:hypothetical protein